MSKLIFVDTEATGQTIGQGEMSEFGAVSYPEMNTFYGDMSKDHYEVFIDFDKWLSEFGERVIFVSDNPAFDWQWINYYFWNLLGRNPFGWSGRRIGDYFAGLRGDFWKSNDWKKWRITKHSHNPVEDALGNCEAFMRIEKDKDIIRGIDKREK